MSSKAILPEHKTIPRRISDKFEKRPLHSAPRTDCLDKSDKPMRFYEQFQAHISAPLIPDEAVYGGKDQRPRVSKKKIGFLFVGLYERIGQWIEEYCE